MPGGKAFLLLGILVLYGAVGLFLASGDYTGNSIIPASDKTTYTQYAYNPTGNSTESQNNLLGSTSYRQCTFVDAIVQLFGSSANCGDTYNAVTGGAYQDVTSTADTMQLGFGNIITNIRGLGWLNLIFWTPLLLVLIYIITSSYEISILGFKIGGSGGG